MYESRVVCCSANFRAKTSGIKTSAVNLATLYLATLHKQPLENGVTYILDQDAVRNERPPAFEGRAGGIGGNPLFQLHKMSFRINSNYVFIPLGIGGLPRAF